MYHLLGQVARTNTQLTKQAHVTDIHTSKKLGWDNNETAKRNTKFRILTMTVT